MELTEFQKLKAALLREQAEAIGRILRAPGGYKASDVAMLEARRNRFDAQAAAVLSGRGA